MEITKMALSGYERQKRWRKKNRVVYNLRRRNARKDLSGEKQPPTVMAGRSGIGDLGAAESTPPNTDIRDKGSSSAQTFTTKKVGEFRMVVIPEEVLEAVVITKPVIFRDDYGRVISEAQWERLQERKRVAKERGYVIDDYSQ